MKKKISTSVLYVIAGCLAAIWAVIGVLWLRESKVKQPFETMATSANETETVSKSQNVIVKPTAIGNTVSDSRTEEMPSVVLEEVDDKTVNIKIYEPSALECYNKCSSITLDFMVPGNEDETRTLCEISFWKQSDSAAQISAYYWENEDSYNEDIALDSPYLNLVVQDDAICFRAVSEEFLSYVKQCRTYRLYYSDEDNLKEFYGQVADAFSFGKGNSMTQFAGTLPSEFATLEEDKEFFTPATNRFKIVEITIYRGAFPFIGYYWNSNIREYVFGADRNNYEYSENPVILTYLISYDEFGPVDARVKIEYASENERDKTTFFNYVPMVDLTGSEEYDEEAAREVLPDLIRESDDYYINEYFNFASTPDAGHVSLADLGITYLGPHGKARYFSYELEGDYRLNGGSLVAVPGVSYFEPEIRVNKIDKKFEFRANEIVDNGEDRLGLPVRTYSSFED